MDKSHAKMNKKLFGLIFSTIVLCVVLFSSITYAWITFSLNTSQTINSPFISVDLQNGSTDIDSINGQIASSGEQTIKYGSSSKTASSGKVSAPVVLKNSGNIDIVIDAIYVSVEFFDDSAFATPSVVSNLKQDGSGYYIEVLQGTNSAISTTLKAGSSTEIISGFQFNDLSNDSNLAGKYFKISILIATHQETPSA